MGGDGEEQLRIRADQHRDGVYGPALKGARVMTVQQRFEFEKDAPSPDAGRRAVDELAKKKADAVKIVVDSRRNTQKKLPAATTAAIIEQAHKDKLKVFAHIYEQQDAERVLDQGIDMLAHIVRDKEVDDAFLAKLKAKRVPLTATMVAQLSFFTYADSPAWLDDPFLTRVFGPERIQIAKTKLKEQQSAYKDQAADREAFEIAQKNFAKMVKAGIRLGLGTDSGPTPHRFEGYFEHMEMELMVKNGMTPMQVITAFSKTNSEALGIEKDYGTLAKGKVADLVVLDRNPLDNILNTRSINSVYLGGRKFE
jgi:imidazolonepropionase-like amidohydrolase